MARADRWQSLIDQQIEQLLQNSKDLPGAGKPFKKEDDNPYAPADSRLANKIMKEHNVAPEWVMLGKTLEAKEQQIRQKIKQALRTHQTMLLDAERALPAKRDAFKQNADQLWAASLRGIQTQVESYNNELLSYNLKVPPVIGQRPRFNLEKEIDKLRRG
ncbi:MAG: hypothetical protein OHK0046_14100 [Anaerolineae bacterium]